MPSPPTFETPEDRLAYMASQLVTRVRDDDPEANGRWLAAQLPDPADWFRLTFVLAAAVPDDRSWRQLTSWTVEPAVEPVESSGEPDSDVASARRRSDAKPCGTPAAARRHRLYGEQVCPACKTAEREYDRTRRALLRANNRLENAA